MKSKTFKNKNKIWWKLMKFIQKKTDLKSLN